MPTRFYDGLASRNILEYVFLYILRVFSYRTGDTAGHVFWVDSALVPVIFFCVI